MSFLFMVVAGFYVNGGDYVFLFYFIFSVGWIFYSLWWLGLCLWWWLGFCFRFHFICFVLNSNFSAFFMISPWYVMWVWFLFWWECCGFFFFNSLALYEVALWLFCLVCYWVLCGHFLHCLTNNNAFYLFIYLL